MTYACPALELAAHTYLFKSQRLRNKALRLEILQGAHWSAIFTQLLTFSIYTIEIKNVQAMSKIHRQS
jgi:hypothetical protein